MPAETRQRMVEAAAGLLRRGGQETASFTEVLARSGAARGGIYHHFPNGKSDLIREAVTWTGERVRQNLVALPGTSPDDVVTAFLDEIRPVVARAAEGVSCAVAAVVVEAGQRDEELTATTHAALQSWTAALEARLLKAGALAGSARVVAVLLVTFLEGTQVLCRAAGDLRPFDEARTAVEDAVGSALLHPRL